MGLPNAGANKKGIELEAGVFMNPVKVHIPDIEIQKSIPVSCFKQPQKPGVANRLQEIFVMQSETVFFLLGDARK